MEQVNGNKKYRSIRWKFVFYIPICALFVFLGAYAIGNGTNEVQDWYLKKYDLEESHPYKSSYQIVADEDGVLHYEFNEKSVFPSFRQEIIFRLISYAQVILIPMWVFACVGICGTIFYKREMEKPIKILMDASKKISQNNLDFEIVFKEHNEFGLLCQSFENMRTALYKNNQETWRVLEERKKLNAAFSHDMRTPITVLKGYVDFLNNYVPRQKISQEKLLEILESMQAQVLRLENYTYRMSSAQKIEDIVPAMKEMDFSKLVHQCIQVNRIWSEKAEIDFWYSQKTERICVDEELVMEVYENLLSNGVRYTKNTISVWLEVKDEKLTITMEDDGEGFSDEAIHHATEPFFGENKEKENHHFGLGLFLCKSLCRKMGGELFIQNSNRGAKVIADFSIQSSSF